MALNSPDSRENRDRDYAHFREGQGIPKDAKARLLAEKVRQEIFQDEFPNTSDISYRVMMDRAQ